MSGFINSIGKEEEEKCKSELSINLAKIKDDPILTEVRICSFCKRKDIIVEPTLADKRDMKLRQLGIK